MENEAKIESKQFGKHLCNIIVKTILTIISVALVGFSIFNIYALINFYDCAPNWRTDNLTLTSYRITANHYNDQKQLVINAYNKQIDEIEKQGLKTRDNFSGIKFRTNVFKNDMHNDRDRSVWDLVAHNKFKSAHNKVFSNVDRKINTLRKYCDKEINNIYNSLQNNQKKSILNHSKNIVTDQSSHSSRMMILMPPDGNTPNVITMIPSYSKP